MKFGRLVTRQYDAWALSPKWYLGLLAWRGFTLFVYFAGVIVMSLLLLATEFNFDTTTLSSIPFFSIAGGSLPVLTTAGVALLLALLLLLWTVNRDKIVHSVAKSEGLDDNFPVTNVWALWQVIKDDMPRVNYPRSIFGLYRLLKDDQKGIWHTFGELIANIAFYGVVIGLTVWFIVGGISGSIIAVSYVVVVVLWVYALFQIVLSSLLRTIAT